MFFQFISCSDILCTEDAATVGRSRAEHEAKMRSKLVKEFHIADLSNDGLVRWLTHISDMSPLD